MKQPVSFIRTYLKSYRDFAWLQKVEIRLAMRVFVIWSAGKGDTCMLLQGEGWCHAECILKCRSMF